MAYNFFLLIFILSTSCCLAQYGSRKELRFLQETNASTNRYADGSYSINDREDWPRFLRERRSKKHHSAPTSKWTAVSQSKVRIPVVLKAVAPQPAPRKHVVIPELKVPAPRQSKNFAPASLFKFAPGNAIECYGKHCIRLLRTRRSRKYRSKPKSKHVATSHSKGELFSKAIPNSNIVLPPVPPQKYMVVPEVKEPEPRSSKNHFTATKEYSPLPKEFVPVTLVEAREPPNVKVPAETIVNCYGKHCVRSLRKRESRKYHSAPSSKHVSNYPEMKAFVLSKYAVEPVVKMPTLPQTQKYVVAPKVIAVPRTKAQHPYMKGKHL